VQTGADQRRRGAQKKRTIQEIRGSKVKGGSVPDDEHSYRVHEKEFE